MSNWVKIQHYVPRFYLEKFTEQSRRRFVFCFDKRTGNQFSSNVTKIACEHLFYDTYKKGQLVEKGLASLESIFSVSYNNFIEKQNLNSLNDADKVALSYYLVIQELRTRETREFISDLRNLIKNYLSDKPLSEHLQKDVEEVIKSERIKAQHIRIFADTEEFAKIIYNLKWVMIKNKTSLPFWTSDHPINRYNASKGGFPYGNMGLISKGIQLYFPLTPILALCILDPVTFTHVPTYLEANDIQNIFFQNSLQVLRCTRFLFSPESDFSLAEKMIADDPSLREPSNRFTIYGS